MPKICIMVDLPAPGTPPIRFTDVVATPSGMIELTTINPAAGNTFKLGAEYYVDFSAAASPAAN